MQTLEHAPMFVLVLHEAIKSKHIIAKQQALRETSYELRAPRNEPQAVHA